MIPPLLLCIALFIDAVSSVHYVFDLSWINAAPDGFNRPVIGVNGTWPPPTIEANVGEEITVVVYNNLGNATTALHWHGIHQTSGLRGIMDGAGGVSQCPIPSGSNFTYSFVANHPGSFWYRKFKFMFIGMDTRLTFVRLSRVLSVSRRATSTNDHP